VRPKASLKAGKFTGMPRRCQLRQPPEAERFDAVREKDDAELAGLEQRVIQY
jgi:hypothetical protein